MSVKKDNISLRQIYFVTIQAQIGVGILTLPGKIALIAENDSWISVLVAGLLVEVVIIIMWSLSIRFPNLTMFEIFIAILGKPLGKTLIVCYCLYFITESCIVLVSYAHVINRWMLERTPLWILMVLLVLACFYITKDSLRSMARFFVLVTPLLVLMIVMICLALKDSQFIYLLPIGMTGPVKIIKGAQEAVFSLHGFEFLFFVYPYVLGTGKQKLKAVTWAHFTVTLIYTILVVVSLAYFMNPANITQVPNSFINLIKSYSLRVIERMDLFFISSWIVSVATTFSYLIFLVSNGLTGVFQKKSYQTLLPYVCIFIFVASLILGREQLRYLVPLYFQYSTYFFQLIIPMLLLIVAIIWKRRRHKELLSHETR